jgi:nucleoside-diphosphate-sugar epimerase
MINLNMAEASNRVKVKKIFYSSSACMYPAYNQEDPDNPKCSEDTACRIQDVRCRISAMRVLPQSVSLSLDRSTLDKPK